MMKICSHHHSMVTDIIYSFHNNSFLRIGWKDKAPGHQSQFGKNRWFWLVNAPIGLIIFVHYPHPNTPVLYLKFTAKHSEIIWIWATWKTIHLSVPEPQQPVFVENVSQSRPLVAQYAPENVQEIISPSTSTVLMVSNSNNSTWGSGPLLCMACTSLTRFN